MEAKKVPFKKTSAKPVYCHHVEDQPGKKGQFMHIIGRKYPWKGYPRTEMVHLMNIPKDVISTPLTYFPKKSLKIVFALIGLLALVNRKLFGRMASWFTKTAIDSIWYAIEQYKLSPLKYTRSVREIYRLFGLLIDREEQEGMKDKWRRLRDIFCLILEYDNSYRFRLQDVLAEIKLSEIAFDEEDVDWIQRRSPWEYRYESVVDYTEWIKEMDETLSKLPKKLQDLAKEAVKYQGETDFVKDVIARFPPSLIHPDNLKKYGFDSLGDFLIKIRNIKYKKVEEDLIKKEEEIMELKAYYEEKLKKMDAKFQTEKDGLIDSISTLLKQFWARAGELQADYKETQQLLASPDKNPLLPAEAPKEEVKEAEVKEAK